MSSDTARVAVVAGADERTGREIARQLAGRGLVVYLGAPDTERGRAAASELRAQGADVRFLHLDVTDEASAEFAAMRLDVEVGRLHVLVNHAGSARPPGAPGGTRAGQARRAYESRVLGVIAVTDALLPLLRKAESARIVNIGGPAGPAGSTLAYGTTLAYGAAEAALRAVTDAYADELRGTAVSVTVIAGACVPGTSGIPDIELTIP
ncbi:SDR family NAD(P)-dependent oxidoreductase [Streptomyces goshikiensis]|uniref:SDR family NAD(P)-dependent oxidoreductase n=1 Tax=Streptomyces goshikiensis TaxID=1942 RepID=UPI00371FDBB6